MLRTDITISVIISSLLIAKYVSKYNRTYIKIDIIYKKLAAR